MRASERGNIAAQLPLSQAATLHSRPILLKNSKLPALANQIAPARLCLALRAINATRATFELQLNVRRSHV
jgi:hypothetical protein